MFFIQNKKTGFPKVNKHPPLVIRQTLNDIVVLLIPGNALHEKRFQRHIGVGPLVSSQERRALAVPRISRGSTGCFVSASVYIGIRLFALSGDSFVKRFLYSLIRFTWTFCSWSRIVVVDAQDVENGWLALGALLCHARVLHRPTLCRPPAQPRTAPPFPVREMSEFWIRFLFILHGHDHYSPISEINI